MAVSFAAYAWNQFGANVTFINSLDVTLPSSIQAGDLLLGVSVSENHADTPAPPSGWTTLDLQGFGTSDLSQDILVAYKVAEASDAGATVTWTYNPGGVRSVVVHIAVYRGVDATTPIAAWAKTGKQTGSSITCPSVTVSSARSGSAVVRLLSGRDGGATTFASGLTQRFSDAGGNGIFPNRNAAADAPWDGSATVNASTVTLANSTVGMAAYTLVLNAAPAVTGLTSTLPGAGTLTGTLTQQHAPVTFPGTGTLAGTPSAQTTATGTFSGSGQLVLSLAASLTTALTGSGSLTLSLSRTAAPTTLLAGNGTLAGPLTRLPAGTVLFLGGGTLTALPTTALASTLGGTGTLDGTLDRTATPSTTLPGSGALVGVLLRLAPLPTSTLSGSGALAGPPSAAAALASTLLGAGTLDGTPTRQGALTSLFAGTGTVIVLPVVTGTFTGAGTLGGALFPGGPGIEETVGLAAPVWLVVAEGDEVTAGSAANLPGILAVPASGHLATSGWALVLLPPVAQMLDEQVLFTLHPGDLFWLIAPLAGVGGKTGLARVLAVRWQEGELPTVRVQLIPLPTAADAPALNEVPRPRMAVERTTNLARLLRKRIQQ